MFHKVTSLDASKRQCGEKSKSLRIEFIEQQGFINTCAPCFLALSPSSTRKRRTEASLSLLLREVNHDVIPIQQKAVEIYWAPLEMPLLSDLSLLPVWEGRDEMRSEAATLHPQVTSSRGGRREEGEHSPKSSAVSLICLTKPGLLTSSFLLHETLKKIKHFKLLLDSLLFAAKSFKETSRKMTNGFNLSVPQIPHLYNKRDLRKTIIGLVWNLNTYYW